MKVSTLFASFLVLVPAALPAQHYVRAAATGNNDGTSWEHAFKYLQDALAAAEPGDTIRVAAGTYRSDPAAADPSLSITMTEDIILLGGFAGVGANPDERDPAVHHTILSGDLNGDDIPGDNQTNRSDNAQHVLRTNAFVTEATLIDGFFIQGGGPVNSNGAGVFCVGAPAFRNCTFRDNYSGFGGGGIYLASNAPKVHYRFERCTLNNNHADTYGGGMMFSVDIQDDSVRIYIEDCLFQENEAGWGGALRIRSQSRGGLISIRRTEFQGNKAERVHSGFPNAAGGGADLVSIGSGSQIIIDSCTVAQNRSDNWGGGLSVQLSSPASGGRFVLTNSVLSENYSGRGGGLNFDIFGPDQRMEIDRCTFSKNAVADAANVFASNGGGINLAVYHKNAFLTVKNSVFSENKAEFSGGGFRPLVENTANNTNINFRIDSCLFTKNEGNYGAGMLFGSFSGRNDTFLVTNTAFIENAAVFSPLITQQYPDFIDPEGGGFTTVVSESQNTRVELRDCIFENNSSEGSGGGLSFDTDISDDDQEDIRIMGTAIINNHAAQNGGGLSFGLRSPGSQTISNCTFENNTAGAQGGAVFYTGDAASTSKTLLHHNRYFNNQSARGAAIATDTSTSLALAYMNGTPANAELTIDNSLFSGNTSDTAVLFLTHSPKTSLTNSTVAENAGAALHLADSSQLELQNNIFYNPGYVEYSVQPGSIAVQSLGGNLAGDNSFSAIFTPSDLQNENPLFEPGSYQLSAGSPAVNAGVLNGDIPQVDLAGNPRVFGGAIDIGAFENQSVVSVEPGLGLAGRLQVSPNPVSDRLTFSIENSWTGSVRAQVFNSLGEQVYNENFQKQEQTLIGMLNLQNLAPGFYYLVLAGETQLASGVFVKQN